MIPKNSSFERLSVDFGDELSKNLTIHKNVKQEIIITTTDKIKLVLIDTKDIFSAQKEWYTPLGVLLGSLATLCTADFKVFCGIQKESWHIFFVFVSLFRNCLNLIK